MPRTYLSWIDDVDLENAVNNVYKSYLKSVTNRRSLKGFHINGIDPFEYVFKTMFTNQQAELWIEQEVARQTQKTLSNAIGTFHQSVLGHCKNWTNLKKDVSELDLKGEIDGEVIYVELKNKFNTMNTSSRKTVFNKLKYAVTNLGASRSYLVELLPLKGVSYPPELWAYKAKNQEPNTDNRIQIVSGDHFYHIVTQEPNALWQLHKAIPDVIKQQMLEGKISMESKSLMTAIQDDVNGDTLRYFFSKAFLNSNTD